MCYIDRAIRTDPQAPMRVSRVAQQCGSRLSGGSEQSLWNRTKNNTKERYRKQNDVLRAPKPYLRDAGRNSIVGLLNFLFYLFMYFEVKTQPGSGACCIWPRCPQVSEKSLYPKTLFFWFSCFMLKSTVRLDETVVNFTVILNFLPLDWH